MCVPLCQAKIAQTISRRSFLKTAGIAAATTVVSGCAQSPANQVSEKPQFTFSRVVDLTHTLTPDFPTFQGVSQLQIETLQTLATHGANVRKWLLVEHTGTHIDAPFHFSDRDTAELIPAENLHGPLAVVDIRSKAENNPSAQLTLDDLKGWESKNGPIPRGGIVAMNSGWDAYVKTDKFRNAMRFPGFHVEAVEFLLEERDVKGICVDTLSLDFGQDIRFAVHYKWLPTNRWGMECVANLGQLPAKGAHVVVGGPKIAGATGGPSRVIALI